MTFWLKVENHSLGHRFLLEKKVSVKKFTKQKQIEQYRSGLRILERSKFLQENFKIFIMKIIPFSPWISKFLLGFIELLGLQDLGEDSLFFRSEVDEGFSLEIASQDIYGIIEPFQKIWFIYNYGDEIKF